MEDNTVKFKFVQETLEKHGKKIIAAMQESIRYNQYQGTGTMEKSAGFSVDRSNNSDGALHIKAIDYLRLQDILASHKSRQKKKNRRRNSIKNNQFTGERKGFYTKTIYQNLNPIIWDLSFGFTQEVIQDIRKRFSEYIIKP